MKPLLILNIAMLFFLKTAFSQYPNVSLIDAELLASKKNDYLKGDAQVVKQMKSVIKNADEFLLVKPESVMDKVLTPVSKSKHDYMSMGPYWWPDPSKPDGLPYIRKDGERNPTIKKITDHQFLDNLENRCQFLSLAYYFTGDEKYAAKAQQLLSVWFLDSSTKMNPNFNYAQAIPGINNGRGIGIIESRALTNLADWINLLDNSKSFQISDKNKIKQWYKEYLHWMLTSENGIDEQHALNNHGTHYDVQITAFALFIGDLKLASQTLTEAKKRISVQIDIIGKQPLELERTNAYSYSTMNLDGWFNLALLGDKVGVNLWDYTDDKGAGLNKALSWLIPYTFAEKPREYKQISVFNTTDIYRVLVIATKKYKGNYTEKLGLIPKSNLTNLTDLLYKAN
jgi:hypothetical protein